MKLIYIALIEKYLFIKKIIYPQYITIYIIYKRYIHNIYKSINANIVIHISVLCVNNVYTIYSRIYIYIYILYIYIYILYI